MSNEFGACANGLNTAIKNDSSEKAIIMDRHCVGGPTSLPVPPIPPHHGAADMPRANINVGSTSWNYNPYFGNFYNYYTSQTYDLGDVSHQYSNQKCGTQFSCNYQQPLAPNSVLQCCDPRCQLLSSEPSEYPFSQALRSKSHQKSKRSRSYYGGLMDLPKPDVTSRPPPDYAASKYTPMAPYSTHMNDLNNKYNGQQMPYNMQYHQSAVKSSKSFFLGEPPAYNNTDFAKQQCWNKPPNLWNPNLSNSYYSSMQQNRGVNHKFPVPLLEQNGMAGAVKHNILHNHSTLEPRGPPLCDSSYMPNYHYMNNRQNHINNHDHRHVNEECSYSHFSGNGHQFQSTYNAHCAVVDNGQNSYYKEFVLKSSETITSKQRTTVDKSPNLDVREFLSTWDEGEDDKAPESEAPVIVLDCTSLEGDALAKVKEKLGDTIADCNPLGNSVTTICELGSQSNATVLKVVDDTNNAIALSKPTSVIQDSGSNNEKASSNCAEKPVSESSHLNSDGIMTWYSNSKKRDEHAYDLVEMTERLVNSVVFGESEKKSMPKHGGVLPNTGYQVSNQNALDMNYIENEWSTDFNCHKRNNDGPSQGVATNHYSNDPSKYSGASHGLSSNAEKSSCHFPMMNKMTAKRLENTLPPTTDYKSASVVQDYSIKYKDNYKQCSDYYQTSTTNSSCQYYNPCYYASSTNMNSCNFPASTGSMESNITMKNNNLTSYIDHSDKNTFENSDITQMKADLEKSLNEITNNLNINNQKGLNTVLENAVENHAPDLPKTCADVGKKIVEISLGTSNKPSTKTTCTALSIVALHNTVIQKIESNATTSEVNEDSGSCDNSLLSMPSLSPPPTSRIPTTSNKCTVTDVTAVALQNGDIQMEEKSEDLTSTSCSEAKSPSKIPENSGNLSQPLNLAIDKDLTKLNGLEISISKVDQAAEEIVIKEVEKKDAPISRSTDLNIGKMDDGYYSIENNFDYDNECHKLALNIETTSQSKDVKDGNVCVNTHQTCIVSCKPHDNELKECKSKMPMSPINHSNLKSKSAPPSLVNMSDILSLEKYRQFKSLVDLRGHPEPLALPQSLIGNCEEASKPSQVISEIIPDHNTKIHSSENLKSHTSQLFSAEENDCTTSVVVVAHQKINPAQRQVHVPTPPTSLPTEVHSTCSTNHKIELLDKISNEGKECLKSIPNVYKNSCKYDAIHAANSNSTGSDESSIACISKNEVTALSNSVKKIETICLSNFNKINGNLDCTSTKNLPANHCDTLSSSAYPDPVTEVEVGPSQNNDKVNGNLQHSSASSSPVNFSKNALSIGEKLQAPSLVQAVDCKPAEDLHRVQISTIAKISEKIVMNESAKLTKSVISSPTYSSSVTSIPEQSEAIFLNMNVVHLGNGAIEHIQKFENINGKRNHKKKLKHKKHKSKLDHTCTVPYKNPRLSKDEDKLLKKVGENDSVIKENTNLLNTSHSPLYSIRSVQDLEMKLSNIRQRLPNDTLLYKCVSKDSMPTNFEDQSSKVEEISESSTCQNENELPQNPYNFNNDLVISVVNNVCTASESTNSLTSENSKLGKHVSTHKNTDLPMKKRKQDLSLYNCFEKPKTIKPEFVHKSKYFACDNIGDSKIKTRLHPFKNYKRPKRRFSFTEYPAALSNNSICDKIDKEYKRSRSLIDWHEDEKYPDSSNDSPISNPCIADFQKKEFSCLSISSPMSPCTKSQAEENFMSPCDSPQHDELQVNSKGSLFNDRVEENNDSLPDTNYYDYNIPSVAPTPQCDLSKEDRFESDSGETCHKSNSSEHDFHLSNTFDDSPVLHAPSTPNCDFLASEDVDENFSNCVQSENEAALSKSSFNEDPEKISSKAPSPCCVFSDVIIDEISEQNPYQPFTVLSPASSVAPSPQCDIIDGVILDHQDLADNIAECDDNNNRHADSISYLETNNRIPCGVPTLQSLAFEALDGISTKPSSSNPDDNNSNVLELWVTPEQTEIIIHSEDQQETTDIVVSEMDDYVETSELYQGMSITSDPFINEVMADSVAESPCTPPPDEDPEEEQCQCVIISNEESVIRVQCSSNSQTLVVHKSNLVEHIDPMIDDTYINGCSLDEEFHFSNNCIEESFIDQKLSCSPPAESMVEKQMYESSSFVDLNEATTYASDLQMKVQLPWHKIFNLTEDLNNYDVGILRELELGPAQVEVRLSSSGSKLWKVVNSKPEFLSSVLKVKRLVLQPAAPTLNDDEENDDSLFSDNVGSSSAHHQRILERVAGSGPDNGSNDNNLQRRQLKRCPRTNARKKKLKTNNMNGIVGVPKVVIRKTSCREYRSYLQDNDFALPTVRLNRYKCLDELALKMIAGDSGGNGSININELKEITSPKRISSKSEDQPAEGNEPTSVPQVTASNADEVSNTLLLESVGISEKPKDTAVGVGSALFPKPSPERHHCLLCHRTYSSEELYQSHVKSKLHRHLELTQRKTIHAMYRYFTGQLCPRLRPLSANERKKMKWKPRKTNVNHFYHEKTPLQIALHKSVFHHRK